MSASNNASDFHFTMVNLLVSQFSVWWMDVKVNHISSSFPLSIIRMLTFGTPILSIGPLKTEMAQVGLQDSQGKYSFGIPKNLQQTFSDQADCMEMGYCKRKENESYKISLELLQKYR